MSVGSEGSIRAQLSIDLAAFQSDVTKALSISNQLGKGLKDIPPAAPRIQTAGLEADSLAARRTLQALSVELGGLPGISGRVSSQLLGVGGSAGAMGAAMAAAGAGVASLAATMAFSAKSAADLEQALASVKSIKLDLDTKSAEDSLHRISQTVGASAVDLSKALYDIFSSIDVPQEQAIALLEQFSKGAIAAQTDTKTFGTAIIGVLNAYKLSADDAAKVSDLFFNTVKRGVVTGPQLAAGLGGVISAARQSGQGLEETFAAAVAVTKEAEVPATALNNLANLFAKLNTKETAKEFANLGIAVVDGGGKIRQVADIARDFITKTAGMTEAAKSAAKLELFPDLQARAGFSTLVSQIEEYDKALAENRGQTGSTAEAYAILAATSEQNFKRFQASLTALSDTFGATLLPAVNVGITALTSLITKFGETGTAIDAWVASDGVRQAAALLIQFQRGQLGFQGAPPTPNKPPLTDAARALEDTPIPFADEIRGAPAAAANAVLGAVGGLGSRASGELAAEKAAALELADQQAEIEAGRERARRSVISSAETLALLIDANDQEQIAARADAAAQEALLGTRQASIQGTVAQAAAVAPLLSLHEKLTAGLASGIGVQVNWNEEIQKALGPTSSVAEELRGPYLEGLLKAKQATDDLSKISQIRDVGIAAQALGLQDAAAKETDVTVAQEKQAAASAFVLAALDAQTRGTAAATASAAALAKPYDDLASVILPSLTAQQQAHIAATKATEGSVAALAEAASLAGVDLSQYGDLTQLTAKQMADLKLETAAAVKGFASFLQDEDKGRITSVLGALASGTNDVVAAQAKQLEAAGHADEALVLLASQYGASAEQAAAWTAALQAGGSAAELAKVQMQSLTATTGEAAVALFEARERLAALTALARDPATGTIRLKVDIDIEAAEKAISDLQNAFREGKTQRAEAQSKATQEFGIQQRGAQEKRAAAGEAFSASVRANEQARNESGFKLQSDIGALSRTQNDAAYKIADQFDDAAAKHDEAWADAGAKYEQSVLDATDALGQGLEGVSQRTQDLAKQATEAAQQSLRTVSGAMQSYNDQARITANATSIALQNAQEANLPDSTAYGGLTNKERIAQIQAAGTAGLAEVAGRNQLNQTLVGANQSLQKATEKAADEMGKLSKETAKLLAAYQKSTDKAGQTLGDALDDADDAYYKTARDANAARDKAARDAARALEKAQDEDRERRKKQAEKENDERLKEEKRLMDEYQDRLDDPEGKGRTKAERDFADAEKARRKAERDADKKYLEDLKKADEQLAALKALKASITKLPTETAEAIAARVKVGEQQFAFSNTTVLETQIDFLSETIGELARQSRKN